jgi:hypothetical protein
VIELSLHDEPLPVDRDGIPRIGCKTLRIRDQYGRELACEFMAWGQLAPALAATFPGIEVTGEPVPDEAIVSSETLEATGEYLLILVKCDHAVLG